MAGHGAVCLTESNHGNKRKKKAAYWKKLLTGQRRREMKEHHHTENKGHRHDMVQLSRPDPAVSNTRHAIGRGAPEDRLQLHRPSLTAASRRAVFPPTIRSPEPPRNA